MNPREYLLKNSIPVICWCVWRIAFVPGVSTMFVCLNHSFGKYIDLICSDSIISWRFEPYLSIWIMSVVGRTPVGQISSFSLSNVFINWDLPELNSPTTTSKKIESIFVWASLRSFLSGEDRSVKSDWTLIRRFLIRLTSAWWLRSSNGRFWFYKKEIHYQNYILIEIEMGIDFNK
jgi:hypothetical protein